MNKVDYNDGSSTSTPYTIFASGGKLKKHTRKTLTLGEIKNLPLGYFEQTMTMSGSTGTNYQVAWDGTNFNKIASMPQNCNGNCSVVRIWPRPMTRSTLQHLQWGNLNFWSQNGGGQFQVLLSNCTYQNQPVATACARLYSMCMRHECGFSHLLSQRTLCTPADTDRADQLCVL